MNDFVFKTKFKDIRFISKCQEIDALFNASVFLFVKEGSVELATKGSSVEVRRNQMALIDKKIKPELKFSNDAEYYILKFSLLPNESLKELIKSKSNVVVVDFSSGCQEHFSSILNIFSNKESFMDIKLNSYLAIIFAEFLTQIDFQRAKENNPFDTVKEYIDANFDNKITLESLCGVVYLSKFYLCRGFLERFGMTIQNYIVSVRINKAKSLLIENELLIKEIAYLVGYDDEMYFSRVFKKAERISPKEYRERFN